MFRKNHPMFLKFVANLVKKKKKAQCLFARNTIDLGNVKLSNYGFVEHSPII